MISKIAPSNLVPSKEYEKVWDAAKAEAEKGDYAGDALYQVTTKIYVNMLRSKGMKIPFKIHSPTLKKQKGSTVKDDSKYWLTPTEMREHAASVFAAHRTAKRKQAVTQVPSSKVLPTLGSAYQTLETVWQSLYSTSDGTATLGEKDFNKRLADTIQALQEQEKALFDLIQDLAPHKKELDIEPAGSAP